MVGCHVATRREFAAQLTPYQSPAQFFSPEAQGPAAVILLSEGARSFRSTLPARTGKVMRPSTVVAPIYEFEPG